MHFKVSAVLPIDARTFLVERDSAAFRALVAETQKLGSLEIRDGWADGPVQVFKLVTKPDVDHFVPKRLQKYLPLSLEYTDVIRYDPAKLQDPPFVLDVHSIPPVFPSKTTINCTLTIEEVSECECRQTLEGDVTIGVLGLGAIAERIICSSLRDVYSGIPEIARRWVAFRDDVLKQPDGREVLFSGRPPLQEDWVSEQVAAVLRAPYPTVPADTADGVTSPAVAAVPPADGAAAVRSPVADGQADVGGTADGGGGGSSPLRQPQPSAFAAVADNGFDSRTASNASTQVVSREPSRLSVEVARGRSVATFEGDVFFTPDDIPDGLDLATGDNMRQDQEEALDWYQQAAPKGLPPAMDAIDESSEPSAAESTGERRWWKRGSRNGRSFGSGGGDSTTAAAATAASDVERSPISNHRNLADWATFWKRQQVAGQAPAPAAAHRLTGLLGIGVKLGLVKEPKGVHGRSHSRGVLAVRVDGGSGAAAAPAGAGADALVATPDSGSLSRRTTKSVGFASPVVNGVHVAEPVDSDDESEDTVTYCFCLRKPRRQRFDYRR
mmetsp:Transcript_21307/g.64113  ORF Transcript_21307/g.64113 Transcript_21307/m.64113 type:complete len:554 (+) Transcript_21307:294-1955(+)|eukprot:CAMPEP_0206143428 /NCGR_PEP_ID=MMETSP1473-20131121/20543_1 /ASSEMBLY_ACC=CAM_ASM_001109 /TAXON_ID=1461547 /ORGANISM="Stichococcus sp, Strain RCC1054" /LENGTH=553 /DNA_ID=CAMNT_0053538833 /DNA_START=247 /DNA_END=1908 /DNA_ORIENTATION=-